MKRAMHLDVSTMTAFETRRVVFLQAGFCYVFRERNRPTRESEESPTMQDILYIQAASTSIGSHAIGMSMIVDGEIVDIDSDSSAWPYQSPLEAVRDGWRVVQFPNTALLPLDDATYGLGFEFILERLTDSLTKD